MPTLVLVEPRAAQVSTEVDSPPVCPSGVGESADASPLDAESQRAFDAACESWAFEFGRGSRVELLQQCGRALLAREAGAIASQADTAAAACEAVEQAHRARYGAQALAAELTEERERDEAVCSDAALVQYQAKWERRLLRLQRAHSPRWHVPGLSPEEVRDALTLRLIEAVRTEADAHDLLYRAGKEWGLLVVQRHLLGLRKSFRLGATPTDFSDTLVLERGLSQEERWLELEADACRAQAHESARRQLTSPQRQWLAAMKFAAHCGVFFQASDQPNLSAASRVLGKHRSAARRAYKELQAHFMRELQALQ